MQERPYWQFQHLLVKTIVLTPYFFYYLLCISYTQDIQESNNFPIESMSCTNHMEHPGHEYLARQNVKWVLYTSAASHQLICVVHQLSPNFSVMSHVLFWIWYLSTIFAVYSLLSICKPIPFAMFWWKASYTFKEIRNF